MPPLTREQLGARVMQLPPGARARAMEALRILYPTPVADAIQPVEGLAPRDPDQRRKYAGDPWKYIADIFGYRLWRDQEEAIEIIEKYDRVLLPSGNNTGKTFIIAAYGIYRFDAVAALPDETLGMEEQGCFLLLPGPDEKTIFSTIYQALLAHADRAERRGFAMPGRRSANSILWRVGPRWQVEAFHPKQSTQQQIAHSASGRHHRNMIAVVEEGQGVGEPVWLGTEGMCSGEGNKIASPFNPREPRGAAFKRARGKTYRTKHISALDHPNVRERRTVIEAAIHHKGVESRIREECMDLGPASKIVPDKTYHDFVYAVTPFGAAEVEGARDDGIGGAPGVEPRVYRPGDDFTAQVLGQWPKTSSSALFDSAALDRAMERHAANVDPSTAPDNVGCDPAREGRDSSGIAPRWGEDAEALLRQYAEAVHNKKPDVVEELRTTKRQRIGSIQIIPKGDGPFVAEEMVRRFPDSPITVDDGGIGTSVFDHAKRVIGAQVYGCSFGGDAYAATPGEPHSYNQRAQLYIRAARLVALGLCDVPNDLQLREELLAHIVKPRSRTVLEEGPDGIERKVRRTAYLLIDKEKVITLLGRSPDRADTFVIAVNGDPAPHLPPLEAW